MRKVVLNILFVTLLALPVVSRGWPGEMETGSVMPLPGSEAALPTVEAKKWVRIGDVPGHIEGPVFDRQGNLYVTSVLDGRIVKIAPDKTVTTIFQQEGLFPDGLAFHKDGRLFVACPSGNLVAMNPDGSNVTFLKTSDQGKPDQINDLVFDAKWNLYVTDAQGTAANPTGGVYMFSAESNYRKWAPVFLNMAAANGIGIPPEGNGLWVAESGRNCMHRLRLEDDGVTLVSIAGTVIAYYFTGTGTCDSLTIDSDGNVYQAMMDQGRVVVLNNKGIAIGNVLMPGRDQGDLLGTTNVAIKPGTTEGYITVSGKEGLWVCTFPALSTFFNVNE